MLILLRKKMRIIFIIILLAIIPGFTLFGIGSLFRAPKKTHIGEINGRKVSYNEYRAAYSAALWEARINKQDPTPDELNDTAWNRLILLDEAKKYHLVTSDNEVAMRIQRIFQRNGKFDKRFYLEILRRNDITPSKYERQIREAITIEKLRDIVLSGVKVTDAELRTNFMYENEKLTVAYIMFLFSEYYNKIKPTDEDLITFFDENKNKYKKSDEVNTKFIFVGIDRFLPEVNVSEDEPKEYYEEHKEDYITKHQVHAQHILFKVSEDSPKEQVEKVRLQAEDVLKKAIAGDDFAELAKKYSQGPSASKGGDLGFFGEGQMVKPFEDAAFSLSANEIYPKLVRTKFGFHIIKVLEVQEETQQPFKDVKDTIIEKIKKEKASEQARSLIEECYYKSDDLKTLTKSAEKLNIPLQETGFFSNFYNIPKVGNSRDFFDQAFALDLFKASEIIQTDTGYYLLVPIDRRSGALPDFSDIKERLTRDFRRDKAKSYALKDANKALEKLESLKTAKTDSSFIDLAKEAGYTAKTSVAFTQKEPDPSFGYGADLANQLFSIKINQMSKPLETTSGIIIAQPTLYESPSEDTYQEKFGDFKQQFMRQKRFMLFQEWSDLIKRNAHLIDRTKYIQGQEEDESENDN